MSDQLNSSGPISLGGSTAGESINLELDASATAAVTMNDTAFRKLGGVVSSGSQISLSQFYGRSKAVAINYSDLNEYPNNIVSQFSTSYRGYVTVRINDGYSGQTAGNATQTSAFNNIWSGDQSFTYSFNTAGGRAFALQTGVSEGHGAGTSYQKVWVSNGASTTRTIQARPNKQYTTPLAGAATITDGVTTISTTEPTTTTVTVTDGSSGLNNVYGIVYGFGDEEGGIPSDWIGGTVHFKYVAPTGDTYTYNINLT